MSDFFVPHITLDGVAAVLSIIGGGVIFLISVGSKLATLQLRVSEHGAKLDRLVTIAEIQARHDERLIEMGRRLNTMEDGLKEIRHGQGFVLPLPK